MPVFSTAHWAIFALALLLGWVLGLMSRSGGRRHQQALDRQRDHYEAELRARDAHIDALRHDQRTPADRIGRPAPGPAER